MDWKAIDSILYRMKSGNSHFFYRSKMWTKSEKSIQFVLTAYCGLWCPFAWSEVEWSIATRNVISFDAPNPKPLPEKDLWNNLGLTSGKQQWVLPLKSYTEISLQNWIQKKEPAARFAIDLHNPAGKSVSDPHFYRSSRSRSNLEALETFCKI